MNAPDEDAGAHDRAGYYNEAVDNEHSARNAVRPPTMGIMLIWLVVFAGVACKWRRSEKKLVDFLGLSAIRLYARLWHGMRVTGQPLPKRGPALVVANHTCSADAALISACADRPLSFLIAAEYYKIPLLQKLLVYMRCVSVSRKGADINAIRQSLRLLKGDHVLVTFPEGGLSNAGRPRLRKGKCGAAYVALRTGVPVVPVLIRGGPQTSDIVPAWLCPSRVHVTVGIAKDLGEFADRPIDRKILEAATMELTRRISALEAKEGRP
jgi:1-acyl-sn-glycerol-3-phosphate acyltransferase